MSGKLIIMAGLAVAFGATSYVAGNHYLESQTQARLDELETNRPVQQNIELAKVVVAKEELLFGQSVDASKLKLIDWPKGGLPEGAFTSISAITNEKNRRAVANILPGEPVVANKLTGKNGRAGLAGIIAEGMRAVTIPVNTVNGVGGFVQPGDRVDLILTHENNETRETAAKVIMQNIKVLSVDQDAGARTETAKVAKSVTLETDTKGAQKITVALNVGSLSLLLRSAGDGKNENAATLDSSDFDKKKSTGFLSFLESEVTTKSIRVVSGGNVSNHTVAIEEMQKNKQPQQQELQELQQQQKQLQ